MYIHDIYIYSQIIYTILYTHIFNIPQLQVTKQKRAGNFKEPPTEWEPLISGQARNKSAGHQPQKDGRGFFQGLDGSLMIFMTKNW